MRCLSSSNYSRVSSNSFIKGTVLITTQRAIQGNTGAAEPQATAAACGHEGSLRIYVRHAQLRRSTKGCRSCIILSTAAHQLTHPLQQSVNTFVYELGFKEDNLEKRKKINGLKLSKEEWGRVRMFCDLLGVSSMSLCHSSLDLIYSCLACG